MTDDRAQLEALLDATTIAHVAYVDDEGRPCVVPTSIARWGDQVVIHGSTGSRWLRAVGDGRAVAVSVAEVTGVVVGHISCETGVHGRSAVLFGQFETLTGDEKLAGLDVMLDRHLPGRSGEVRRPTGKELAATQVMVMRLDQWSCRVMDEEPKPPQQDADAATWSGTVSVAPRTGTIEPSRSNQAQVPGSVVRLADDFTV